MGVEQYLRRGPLEEGRNWLVESHTVPILQRKCLYHSPDKTRSGAAGCGAVRRLVGVCANRELESGAFNSLRTGPGGTDFIPLCEDHRNSVPYLRAISLICSRVRPFGGAPGGVQVSRKNPSRPGGDINHSRRSSCSEFSKPCQTFAGMKIVAPLSKGWPTSFNVTTPLPSRT